MPMQFGIEAPALLKWARFGEEMAAATRPAIADALNAFGDAVVNDFVVHIEEQTGLSEVRRQITVRHATASNLQWSMDARGVIPAGTQWGREWTEANAEGHGFSQDRLMNIVTCDETACTVCQEIAAKGPYTIAEIDNMSLKWAHYVAVPPRGSCERTNLIHPNCQCTMTPFRSMRRVPVSMGARRAPEQLMTAGQVARAMTTELQALIRAKLR